MYPYGGNTIVHEIIALASLFLNSACKACRLGTDQGYVEIELGPELKPKTNMRIIRDYLNDPDTFYVCGNSIFLGESLELRIERYKDVVITYIRKKGRPWSPPLTDAKIVKQIVPGDLPYKYSVCK